MRVGDKLDYPYPACRPWLRAMLAEVGADRLLWGTDMPFQNRFCTYRQSRSYIEGYCRDFISDAEMADLMGGTCARLLGVTEEVHQAMGAAPRGLVSTTPGAHAAKL